MADCCTGTPLDIGCFGSCDQVETGVNTVQAGDHIIKIANTGRELLTVTLGLGDEIAFTNPFNEDSCTIFQVEMPDGNLFTTSGGTDCFVVETLITGTANSETDCLGADIVYGGESFVNS